MAASDLLEVLQIGAAVDDWCVHGCSFSKLGSDAHIRPLQLNRSQQNECVICRVKAQQQIAAMRRKTPTTWLLHYMQLYTLCTCSVKRGSPLAAWGSVCPHTASTYHTEWTVCCNAVLAHLQSTCCCIMLSAASVSALACRHPACWLLAHEQSCNSAASLQHTVHITL